MTQDESATMILQMKTKIVDLSSVKETTLKNEATGERGSGESKNTEIVKEISGSMIKVK